MNIDYNALNSSLQLMWQGMLGIFVVMITISVIVYLITKFANKPNQQ